MQDKARKLFELTDTGKFPPVRPNAPPKLQEIKKALANGYRDLRIRLFTEHYTEEQLDALLEFYESDLGRSILQAQAKIEDNFKEEFSRFMQSLDQGDDGGMGVIVERKD